MRKVNRLILITGLLGAICLTGYHSGAAQTNPINSNVATSDQPNRFRKNQFRFGNTVFTIKRKPSTSQVLSNHQIKIDLHQLRTQTFRDLQSERAEHVSTRIKPVPKLNRLAELRARQVAKRFSHYNQDHKPMTTVDAHRVGLPAKFQGSENIASSSLGNCTMFADPKIYHNHNGKDMANMNNDGMMNYDAFEQNGHRKNILNNDNSLVGIGAAYSPRKHTFYLTEDFGNEDPQSSEDVNKQRIRFHLRPTHQMTFKTLWRAGQNWAKRMVQWIGSKI